MRRTLGLIAVICVTGCVSPQGQPAALITRPAAGYEAVRIVQTFRVAGPVGNTLEFPAGATFVADRVRVSDRTPLWCGPMTINDTLPEYRLTCFRREGGQIFLMADRLDRGWPRDVPEGAFEVIQLR